MNKSDSLKLTAYITKIITEQAPFIDKSDEEISNAEKYYSEDDLSYFKENRLYDGNFRKFFILKSFCDKYKIWDAADVSFLAELFSNAKVYSSDDFCRDDYLQNIKITPAALKNNLLMNVCYEKNEIFQYDMPDLYREQVVPKLAFFDKKTYFPSVYEGNIPWVSVCPSEINSMSRQIEQANGRCLVLGLGLGYYPYMISRKKNVKTITIVEINEDIIKLFEKFILPQFDCKEKIKIVHGDAVKYVEEMSRDEFDFCFADIWEGQQDGAEAYLKIKPCEARNPYTVFTYWIEDQIRWYIENIL